jgi:hypothetical protein
MVLADRIGPEEKKKLKRRCQENRTLAFSKMNVFLLSAGVLVFWLILIQLTPLVTQEACANQSISFFREMVKSAIKMLSVSLMDSVVKNNTGDIQTKIDKMISDAEKEGKPIQFGIGILDRTGVAVAGRYVVGTFRKDDFSRYQFVKKAFKQKKVIQDRLYFQDHSELWIVCVPLVQQRGIVGAIVLGFNPTEVDKDYGLNVKQFLALDLNK